jgi:hypothetical protein
MPAPLASRAQRCTYCATLLAPAGGAWAAAPSEAVEEPLRHPTRTRFWIGGHRHALLGRLAVGRRSDAFLAERDGRLTERLVIRFPRSDEAKSALRREDAVLSALQQSQAQGSHHFSRLLPQRVALGTGRLGTQGQGGERFASVHRWRSGFVHSGLDVQRAHSSGIAPEHVVWMWKRLLEVLGFVHASGYAHGAVAPEHVLVHARDHGALPCGWSHAGKLGEPLVRAEGLDAIYPADQETLSVALDLSMVARTLCVLSGGTPEAPSGAVPEPLAVILRSHAAGELDASTAWIWAERVQAASTEVFGPPRFVPFPMPGWGD